ncbi:MAG: putative glycoside hydrolase [Patescibacteria group bacterium]
MRQSKHKVILGGALIIVGITSAAISASSPLSFVRTASTTPDLLFSPQVSLVRHVSTPEPMYAIYMTQCVVGTASFREALVKFVDETKLNAIIIDIKDFTGKISYPTDNPALAESVSEKCGADDMKEFIETLHDKDIYVIGRITVFQDPYYTKNYPEQSVQSKSRPGEPWKDYKGLSFVAVNAQPFWEYIVELSKESYALGFDELNYDYVRWPSDGPMSDIVYPSKDLALELEKFFRYLNDNVKPTGVAMSADLFGMTTTNFDDLNIGQQLERALPYFDYVAPMVYPSHYPKNFLGLGNPNSDPYKVVQYSMSEAARRTIATTTSIGSFAYTRIGTSTPALYSKPSYDARKLRPWLQDFDYGKDYLPADILAQTRATYDAGLTSWFFWDPANRYTSLREVLMDQ